MKHTKRPIKFWLTTVGGAILAIALIVGLVLVGLKPWEEATPETTTTVPVTTVSPIVDERPVDEFEPIELGSGLKLTGLSAASGNFPEDGSDEFVYEMLSATFTNEGAQTLQYAKVHVTIDGEVYTFEFSTLPAGKTVRAFEVSRKNAPAKVAEVSANAESIALFPTQPSLLEDQLEITVHDGYITVKNITDRDFSGELSIFFKSTYGDIYMGGITYRVRIAGLKAGESLSGYSSHAYATSSEIMFVQYVD